MNRGATVLAYAVRATEEVSEDFATNCSRWKAKQPLHTIEQEDDLPELPHQALVVDALFGSGLSRPVTGIFATVIAAINAASARVISVDVPSGLFIDQPTSSDASIVRADRTFTFQMPKLAFLLPQHQAYVGRWRALDISLDHDFLATAPTPYHYTDDASIQGLHKQRPVQSHKGNFGKGLLVAGSYGKMGAAVLSTRACLRGGIGLLTVHTPACGYEIMQISAPEAMATVDDDPHTFSQLDASVLDNYDTLGIGPGLGTSEPTVQALHELLPAVRERELSLVMDADALNICGKHRALLEVLPPRTILTPHPKEFERLTEPAKHDFHRLNLLQDFCRRYQVYVVLKGSHTAVGTPHGDVYFNSTGNPGMATGGSGDVLTGLLTALLAQGYDPLSAARLGVYVHGLAGDLAVEKKGEESLIASDLIDHVGAAFMQHPR